MNEDAEMLENLDLLMEMGLFESEDDLNEIADLNINELGESSNE